MIRGRELDPKTLLRVLTRKSEVMMELIHRRKLEPLPGTEDQVRYAKEGDIIDWDFNQLDSQHVTLRHPRLDTAQWMQAYKDALDAQGSDEEEEDDE